MKSSGIKKSVTVLLFLAHYFCAEGFGKIISDPEVLKVVWNTPKIISIGEQQIKVFSFEGASYTSDFKTAPYFVVTKENSFTASIEAIETVLLTEEEKNILLQNKQALSENFIIESYTGTMRNEQYTYLHICPVRFNKSTGDYEKLLLYKLHWFETTALKKTNATAQNFASASVLATGSWYKIAIAESGVYKIDKAFLSKLGMDVASLNPNNLRIYGNGGKILAEKNSGFRYDDLNEIAIDVVDGNDNVFNDNDYVLFYASGTHYWKYNNASSKMKFTPIKNFYSDSAFYFITVDNGIGKRMQDRASLLQADNYTVTSFDDYAIHETDAVNLVKSGREMYGEYFDIANSYTTSFSFPSITSLDTVRVAASVAGRNTLGTADFKLSYPGGSSIISCGQTGSTYTDDVAIDSEVFVKYLNTGTGTINLVIDKITAQATGWLNYVMLNVRRNLVMSGNQLSFRDSRSVAPGNISKFILNSAGILNVWDVSDPFNVKNQLLNTSSGSIDFTVLTDSLKEFRAFTGSAFYHPTAIGKIENQNLHALQPADYIIITHPLFKQSAQKLATLHNTSENLSSIIVTPDEIYNEFSSGMQDISAIRDFVRMLYKRAGTANLPQYLLLLGDGSYDNLHRYSSSNTNYIPTYQNVPSLSYQQSYTSDDFFGFMDDNEGDFSNSDIVDLGVGRIPVSNIAQAENVVNKIMTYYKKDPAFNPIANTSCTGNNKGSFGEWRNWICFVADDEDKNGEKDFVIASEGFASTLATTHPIYNIDKIYIDAYKQETSPGGERYPDVNEAIDKRMEKGALIMNYCGHGGELGWAHEAIIDVPQILNWKNISNMPFFVTATCEFSRYDDPARTSAGEYVLLNANGGGIALFTTTRLAYMPDAHTLCPKVFATALAPMSTGKMPAIGDITRLTKSMTGASYRYFTLLGDPALVLAYPGHTVYTTEINQHPLSPGVNDTIAALQKVTIKGYIGDKNGTKISSYNGVIYPTVFDKPVQYSTLGNDNGPGSVVNFKLQKNVLYKGKANVSKGDYEFSFIAPKDILYQYGFGRISYYTQNADVDGAGYYDKIIVGGSDPHAKPDNTGPEVKLFMNDNKFVYGGTTNEHPALYAEVFDSSGINTVGNGIGHDLVAVLDANSNKSIELNEYYQADLNSFQSGKISYPFSNLPEGVHDLKIKVWDVQNNSSTSSTQFVVAPSAELALRHVLNYPNPFTTSTKFFIEHNQCCSKLHVEIQVFTVSGKIVKTINQALGSEGFRTEGIEWDGKDDYGDKIGRGVYVYRIVVKDDQGKSAEKFEKLVLLN